MVRGFPEKSACPLRPGYRLLCGAHTHSVYPGGQLQAQDQRGGWGSLPDSRCTEEQGRRPAARDALSLAAGRAMLEADEISKEDYDKWRYHYPEFDKSQKIAEVMSQELSDIFKDINDSDRR